MLEYSVLLQLKRWNTPTIFNGWEQITNHNVACEGFNLEETKDFMPQMGSMVGYAATVKIQPGNGTHVKNNPSAWQEYRKYIASVPGPKIVVVQDMDKPETYGSFWGEVNSNVHRALGCVGTITDGAIRDLDEMYNAGFKAIARRMCVGHAFSFPIEWNCEVDAFKRTIKPNQLIHADKHGFLVIPEEDEEALLDAVRFMDSNECQSLIHAARTVAGKSTSDILTSLNHAGKIFKEATKKKFGKTGEW